MSDQDALSEALERAERAEEELRNRDTFLAIIAHELRNPIAPVLIALEAIILEVSAGCVQQETLLDRLRKTHRFAGRLRTDLDRLLDFSRFRSGSLEIVTEQDVDLNAIIDDSLRDLAPLLEAAGCEVRTELAPMAVGDWDRMRLGQVVWNLLSNAIKYAPAAPIDVVTMANAQTVQLTVRDHGPGIPEDEQELVFRKYERLYADKYHTGFGVGLWLVRAIITAMGGTIALASSVGEGSTFSITLPRRR